MDKKSLKQALKKFVTVFEEEGQAFDFVGITPVYPGSKIHSYVLQVHAEWLTLMPNHSERLHLVIEKLYSCLSPDFLRGINRVEICDKEDHIRCIQQDVIVNHTDFEIPYFLAPVFSE